MGWTLRLAMLAALACLVAGQAQRRDLLSFLYTAAARYEAGAWTHGGERFPDGAHLVLVTGTAHLALAPEFFASADATVSFDSLHILFAARPTRKETWQIWEADLTGGTVQRVSTNSDACIRPLYLPGGDIVYTRLTRSGSEIEVLSRGSGKVDVLTHAAGWYLTDDVLHDGRILFESDGELFTVYPDGTGVETLRCDHGPRRAGGRQILSGDVVFAVGGGLARFTSALTTQQTLPVDLEVAGPVSEVSSGRWLAAARPRSGGKFAIYQGGPATPAMERVEFAAGLDAVEPVVVAVRVPPRAFPSALVPARRTGNLLCLDVKEAKPAIDGRIHAVRLYTRDPGGASRILGQTAVAADGSFFVEVPADQPIRMELLDATGTRLRGEEHWFWMRPSEQRICVGCHAGPERAPENKVPEILNQILKPVKLLGETVGAQ